MAKAIWNGAVIAQSDTYEMVEGNVYFPQASLDRRYIRPSDNTSGVRLEGYRQVLRPHRRWRGQPRCGLVLQRPEARGTEDPGPCCILERRSCGPLTLEGVGSTSPRFPTKASIRHARNSAIAPRDRLPTHPAQEARNAASQPGLPLQPVVYALPCRGGAEPHRADVAA